MSGAPWTSSQNAVLNLVLMLYLDLKTKNPTETHRQLFRRFRRGEVTLVVEGDDGLVASDGFDEALIARLGLKLKMDKYSTYRLASFCGHIFAEGSTQVLTDPVKHIVDFAVLPTKFFMQKENSQYEYQRARAMSGFYTHRKTPILSVLFSAVLMRTRGRNDRLDLLDSYHSQQVKMNEDFKRDTRKTARQVQEDIEPHTRREMENLYGFTVDEQIMFEEAYIRWSQGEEACVPSHPRLELFFTHGEKYVRRSPWEDYVIRKSVLPDVTLPFLTGGVLDPKKKVYNFALGTYHRRLAAHQIGCEPIVPGVDIELAKPVVG